MIQSPAVPQTYRLIQNYQYSLGAILGRGSFGTVYKASNVLTGQLVAIKVIDRKVITTEGRAQVDQETQIMQKFQHPNLVRLIDVLDTANNKYIVSEYCNGQDLREYLKTKVYLKEPEALTILKDIVAGLQEMVAQNVIHRDLKPANIIRHNQSHKITDFGFSRPIQDVEMMQSMVGTPLYMAPQILIKSTYSNKCDIWSLGMLYYEMLYGVTPWMATSIEDLIRALKTQPLTFPPDKCVSPQSKQFLRRCLQIDEKQRYSWTQIFDHVLLSPSIKFLTQSNQTSNLQQIILLQLQQDHHATTTTTHNKLPKILRDRSASTTYAQLVKQNHQSKCKLEEVVNYDSSQSTVHNSKEKRKPTKQESRADTQRPISGMREQEYYLPPPILKKAEGMRRTRSQLDFMPTITRVSAEVDILTMQRVLTNKNCNQTRHQRNIKNIFDGCKNKKHNSTVYHYNNNEDHHLALIMRLISKIEKHITSCPGLRKQDALNLLMTHRNLLQKSMLGFDFLWEAATKTINELQKQLRAFDTENAKNTMFLLSLYLKVLKSHKDNKDTKMVLLDANQIADLENLLLSDDKENRRPPTIKPK